MKKEIQLLPRQEQILSTLFENDYVPIEELAEKLKVSSRTVQRDLKEIKSLFQNYGLRLIKDKNKGFSIDGESNARKKMFNDLYFHSKKIAYTQAERQFALIVDLLTLNDPLKLYNLSHKYNVSETTISHDLDDLENLLNGYGIALIRKPGFGIEISGEEENRRMALFREIAQKISVEDWLNLLEFPSQAKHKSFFNSLLFSFFNFDKIISLDRFLRPIIQKNAFQYRDRDYVHLLVQIMISMKRIEEGHELQAFPKDYYPEREYDLTLFNKIDGILSFIYQRKISQYDKLFFLMQLINPVPKTFMEYGEGKRAEFISKEVVRRFVYRVGIHLNTTVLVDDDILINGITSHLNSSFQRLNRGISIINPLHEKIVSQNYDYYRACQQSKGILEKEMMGDLSDDEIGYISLHIAASMIRNESQRKVVVKAIIVCSSGMGTSHFLASRIIQEFDDLEIIDSIPMIKLEEWLEDHEWIDLIISTVPISFVENDRVVKVTPLLEKRDISLLQSKIDNLQINHGPQSMTKSNETSTQHLMLSIARYGEALLQIQRNIKLFHLQSFSFEKIFNDSHFEGIVVNTNKLIEDLKERERKGPFVYQDLAIIHTRSEGINELLVAVYRLDEEFQWQDASENKQKVKHVLLLASPLDVPDESINMISQISANLIDDHLLNAIKSEPEDGMKKTMIQFLTTYYQERINAVRDEK